MTICMMSSPPVCVKLQQTVITPSEEVDGVECTGTGTENRGIGSVTKLLGVECMTIFLWHVQIKYLVEVY